MTDYSPQIFELWTMERELRKAGKWPEGAPYLVFEERCLITGLFIGARLSNQISINAALWRIMQLVAWWSWHRNELLEKHVNESYWFAATPADWIAAAKKILEGWE